MINQCVPRNFMPYSLYMIKLPTSLIKFFWYFIKKYPLAFLVFFLTPLSIVLQTNGIPYALKLLIDAIIKTPNKQGILIPEIQPALWIGVISWCGLITITRLQNWWEAYVIPNFEADIRMSVLDYVLRHSSEYFSNNRVGSLASRINDLPKSIETIRVILCWNGISTVAVVGVSLGMMTSINPLFSLILGTWIAVHLIISLYCAGFIKKHAQENAADRNTLNGNIVDVITNINSVKLFSRYAYELSYVGRNQLKEKTSHSTLILTINITRFMMDVSVTLMLGIVFYCLITDWQQQKISPGSFVFTFNVIFAVMNQVWEIGHVLTDLFREIGTAEKALDLVRCSHQITDAQNAHPLVVRKGTITFEDVIFHYNKGRNIFQNKSITIKGGQKVGLVGLSGSGKSTFVNLILRFFELNSGRITIDHQNIAHVTQASLHENIAVIPQDIALFNRSVLENIRYGHPAANDEEVIAAAKKSCCHEFIGQLPEGYKTLVGERGIKLSGGQRQRIAIARAILKNAPILILDEATSALDSMTEQNIQKSLYQLMKNRTTLVIAHRLSTLSEMDRILVFDKGRIIEDGSHASLLGQKGHYFLLWQMQVNGFLPSKKHR